MPIFADQILHCGPVGLGWMRAAPAVGAFAMALVVAHLPPMKQTGKTLLWCVSGFGIATILFGLSKIFWLSLGLLFLLGAFDSVSVIIRGSIVQLVTPDEMRGRVSSGVTSWTIDPRMITLTLSNAPRRNNKPSDNQNILDNPKRIVAIPNPVTHHIKVWPACFIGGRCATTSATAKAPIAGAARSHPRPTGPTCRIWSAKIGISAVAPPSSTANRSSVMVARITFLRSTNRIPAIRLFQVLAPVWSRTCVLRWIGTTRRKKENAQRASSR